MPNHEMYEVAGLKVKTIGLDDLIRVKEYISRSKHGITRAFACDKASA